MEIHTPKLIGGASEGGSDAFRLDYFGRDACLAQSPQLYKQMGVCCDLQKVFEVTTRPDHNRCPTIFFSRRASVVIPIGCVAQEHATA